MLPPILPAFLCPWPSDHELFVAGTILPVGPRSTSPLCHCHAEQQHSTAEQPCRGLAGPSPRSRAAQVLSCRHAQPPAHKSKHFAETPGRGAREEAAADVQSRAIGTDLSRPLGHGASRSTPTPVLPKVKGASVLGRERGRRRSAPRFRPSLNLMARGLTCPGPSDEWQQDLQRQDPMGEGHCGRAAFTSQELP